MKYFLLFLALTLIFPIKSFPFETDISSVITPSRLLIRKDKVPATISVIESKQLERQKAFSVEEVLRNIPGIYIQSSGTPGEQSFARIRGAEADQVLILIDGVQVNSPWSGNFDLGNLTVDNVERIEVLKGNHSALYGSNALGGVINIITKKGKGGLKSTVKVGAGNQETFREEFHNERGWEKFNYSFAVSRNDSSGQYQNDSYDNTSAAGQTQLNLANNLSIAYRGYYNKANKEIGVDYFSDSSSTFQSFFDDNWKNSTEQIIHNVTLDHNPTDWWDYTIQGSTLKDELVLDNKASPELGVDIFYRLNADRYTIRNQHNFHMWKSNVLTLGLEYKREEADRKMESPVVSRINENNDDLGFYIQNIYSHNNTFFLSTGFRADNYSSFGYTYNPKISAAYRFSSTGTKFKGSWGTGFSAPNIQELYTPTLGNPNLKPEKTVGYEAGIEQELFDNQAQIEVVFFHTDFENLIQKSVTGVDNVGNAKTEGVELSIRISLLDNLDLSGNYTYLNAKNTDTDEPLSRPENIWNFSIFYQFRERLQINMDINIVGAKFDDDIFTWVDGTRLEGPVDGYQKIDLALSYLLKQWTYTNKLNIFGKINNLLDQKYFENKGFKAPGINFFGGLKLSF